MLTTIEEKLSAIKAINEQRDIIDSLLHKIYSKSKDRVFEIFFTQALNILNADVTEAIQQRIANLNDDLEQIIIDNLTQQRDQLITKATELMK